VNYYHLDLETFSSINLAKCGTYRYSESPDFEILLLAYSFNHESVKVVDLAQGEAMPQEIIEALLDDETSFIAHNANFERICLSQWLRNKGYDFGRDYLNPKSWHCSMVWSATLGLPLSLQAVGTVLELDKQKLSEGKDLIRYFCVPCNPTKSNGNRTRNLPIHDLEKWERFKTYNIRDVEVEMGIQDKLSRFPVSQEIWEEYWLDQEINDRGVKLDLELVNQAITLDKAYKQAVSDELKKITGLENPNSVMQMLRWLKSKGLESDSLGKQAVEELLDSTQDDELRQVLLLRQQLARTSVKKYQVMRSVAGEDKRARGLFIYYGANRTGRWSGRLIQLQNLYRNKIPDLVEARALVKQGNYELFEILYDDVSEILAQLIRTSLVPKDGYKFIVSDFSSIEAVVIAWLAGEEWVIDSYAKGEDLYIENAKRMFGAIEVSKDLRQKSKIAVLACSYGGSVGALNAFGATKLGIAESELKPTVDAWRNANPNIVKLWWACDRAAKQAIKERTTVCIRNLLFSYQSGFLFITLPSGRNLAYVKPRIGTNKFSGECITYEGTGHTRKWERIESWGPKLVENCVQGIARDILAHALHKLSGYRIVSHIHDEVIVEVPLDVEVADIIEEMCQLPDWIGGLPMRADGYECQFYKKD
jgi:DNA polymerase